MKPIELGRALNRLAKWRTALAGWQLGTRTDTDAECQAVRDHREATLILRAEVTALTVLLLEKQIFTKKEIDDQISIEAQYLEQALERQFPGFKATDSGMSIDVAMAQETMRGWRP